MIICVHLTLRKFVWIGKKAGVRMFLFIAMIIILRLFLGKNSIAQIALGRTPEEEYKDNLRHISAVNRLVYIMASGG